MQCGCGFTGDYLQWQEHVAVCARRHGKNASTTHAFLKDTLKRVLHEEFHMTVESNEPRQYRQILCAGCGAYVSDHTYDQHATTCNGAKEKSRMHISGPDIRAHSNDGTQTDPIVFDVTVVNQHCKSNSARPAATVTAERKREKHTLYDGMMRESGDEFVVACVTATGNLDGEFVKFLKDQCGQHDVPVGDVIDAIACSVVASTASNLVAAERRHRQLHRAVPRPVDLDDSFGYSASNEDQAPAAPATSETGAASGSATSAMSREFEFLFGEDNATPSNATTGASVLVHTTHQQQPADAHVAALAGPCDAASRVKRE
jgi:hypothetical protein